MIAYVYGTITLYGATFQKLQLNVHIYIAVLQPQNGLDRFGLGCSLFARHYLGNLYLISLPGGTEMFHFPPFASHTYGFSVR